MFIVTSNASQFAWGPFSEKEARAFVAGDLGPTPWGHLTIRLVLPDIDEPDIPDYELSG